MSFSTFIFKAIDVIYDYPQNKRKPCKDKNKTVCVKKDIIYDNNKPDVCKFDFYYSSDKTNKEQPAIFEIHGGGFVAGDKKRRRGLCNWFIRNTNAVVINVNYSLAPSYKFPSAIYDLINALNFIVDKAKEFNIDKNKIIVTGDSAGAYYASILCAINNSEQYRSLLKCSPINTKILGCVLNCGLYDLQKVLSNKLIFNISSHLIKDLLATTIQQLPSHEFYQCLSPIPFMNSDFPSTFITYSKKDIFCKGQGELLIDKLQKLNINYKTYSTTNFKDNHAFPLTWNSKNAKENNKLMLEFINDLFKEK